MGVVQGSTNWNGQDNFQDFIQFHADKLGMTREEYMAHYGRGIDEADKKPGPDPYHRGLEDDEVEDKEDQIKKQADMDDDDPDAYKEMPGDKEAREKGEVKTSKATKAYNKLYKENKHVKSMNEMAMGYDAHTGLFYIKGVPFTEERLEQVLNHLTTKVKLGDLPKQFSYFPAIQVADNEGGEIVTITLDKAKEIRATLKRFKGKLAHDGDFNENVIELNHSGNEASDKMAYSQLERIIDYATMLRDRMAAGKGLDAWMYGKIVKAEDYLNTLYDVVDGDDGVVEIVEEGLLGQVRSRIGKTQTALKKKWDKKGGYENFGQDEIRKLQDEYDYNSMVYGTPEQRKAAKLIDALDQWAMNYVGEATTVNEDDKDQKSTDRGPLDDDKIETALKKKAQDTGVPIGIIRAVMRRGLAAWKSGHRPGANQQQWGYARVNAFLTKGEGTWGNADKDLAKEVRDGGHDKKLKKA